MAQRTQISGRQDCSVKTCVQAAVGTGAQIPKPLCQRHLDLDLARVRELQSSVQSRLQPVKSVRDKLRADQQALEAELQASQDVLEASLEALASYKEAVLSRLAAKNEAAVQQLREFAVLQEYESSMNEAETTNNMRAVFELASNMELECSDLEEALTTTGRDTRVAFGDVTGGLRDLRLAIDQQMDQVLQLCESNDTYNQPDLIFKFEHKIDDLGAKPIWLTPCTNTKGYFSDESGRILKPNTSFDVKDKRLPKSGFFVTTDGSNKDHLLLVSVDGSCRLKCYCDIDKSSFISGLYCDNDHQLLYLVQQRSVTVTDLSGCVSCVIDSLDLGRPLGYLCGCDANGDKILFFDQQERKIFGIGRLNRDLQTVIDVAKFYDSTQRRVLESLAVLDSTIYLTDFYKSQVHKLCSISGNLKSSYPTMRSTLKKFNYPSHVATANNGLLFVCEFKEPAVRVLASDGSILQTLDVPATTLPDAPGGGDTLFAPHSATLLLTDNCLLLAVADKEANSLSLYKTSLSTSGG